MILAGEVSFRKWNFSEEIALFLEQYQEKIPTMAVLATEEGKRKQRPTVLFESGLYLGRNSRLFNWERGNQETLFRIWSTFWSDLHLSV